MESFSSVSFKVSVFASSPLFRLVWSFWAKSCTPLLYQHEHAYSHHGTLDTTYLSNGFLSNCFIFAALSFRVHGVIIWSVGETVSFGLLRLKLLDKTGRSLPPNTYRPLAIFLARSAFAPIPGAAFGAPPPTGAWGTTTCAACEGLWRGWMGVPRGLLSGLDVADMIYVIYVDIYVQRSWNLSAAVVVAKWMKNFSVEVRVSIEHHVIVNACLPNPQVTLIIV